VLATEHRLGSVGPFGTGHSMYVRNTDRISNHAVGRAVDIAVIEESDWRLSVKKARVLSPSAA
jgi:hypothetical protein